MEAAARLSTAFTLALTIGTAGYSYAGQTSWDIEVHGGGALSRNTSHGTTSLPPPGTIIAGPLLPTSLPSRAVPSWYFGDGAALLNQAAAGRPGLGIVSLDPVLKSPLVERESGASV